MTPDNNYKLTLQIWPPVFDVAYHQEKFGSSETWWQVRLLEFFWYVQFKREYWQSMSSFGWWDFCNFDQSLLPELKRLWFVEDLWNGFKFVLSECLRLYDILVSGILRYPDPLGSGIVTWLDTIFRIFKYELKDILVQLNMKWGSNVKLILWNFLVCPLVMTLSLTYYSMYNPSHIREKRRHHKKRSKAAKCRTPKCLAFLCSAHVRECNMHYGVKRFFRTINV